MLSMDLFLVKSLHIIIVYTFHADSWYGMVW